VGGYGGGALVGYDHISAIHQCFSTGFVKGKQGDVGGLIGRAFDSSVIGDCYSRATVSGEQNVGGLLGLPKNDAR